MPLPSSKPSSTLTIFLNGARYAVDRNCSIGALVKFHVAKHGITSPYSVRWIDGNCVGKHILRSTGGDNTYGSYCPPNMAMQIVTKNVRNYEKNHTIVSMICKHCGHRWQKVKRHTFDKKQSMCHRKYEEDAGRRIPIPGQNIRYCNVV